MRPGFDEDQKIFGTLVQLCSRRGANSFVVAGAMVLFVFLGVTGDAQGYPAEPHATFALKNGWVEFALRKDGQPVAAATIEIIDEKGGKFAEGETGADGQASFPLPAGSSFVVEIKAGEKTADPIRLFRSDGGVEPERVLLSYGLRPCCRSVRSRGGMVGGSEEVTSPALPKEESAMWDFVVPGLAGVGIAAMVVFMAWRRFGAVGLGWRR